MTATKLTNAQVELANEIAKVVGKSVVVEGTMLRFDVEDAVELAMVAADCEKFWMRMRKTSKAKAACNLREKLAEIVAAERYALSFAK